MPFLAVFQTDGELLSTHRQTDEIQSKLREIGADLEIWSLPETPPGELENQQILDFYSREIEALNKKFNFKQVDVVRLTPDHPKKDQFRETFIREHIHSDFEIRFFVEGSGLFYVHAGDRVFGIWCDRGTLLSVPARAEHWFDMGEKPSFTCIRFFTEEDGWVAQYTDSGLEKKFPLYGAFKERFQL